MDESVSYLTIELSLRYYTICYDICLWVRMIRKTVSGVFEFQKLLKFMEQLYVACSLSGLLSAIEERIMIRESKEYCRESPQFL